MRPQVHIVEERNHFIRVADESHRIVAWFPRREKKLADALVKMVNGEASEVKAS